MTKAEETVVKKISMPPSTVSSLMHLAETNCATPSEVVCRAINAYELLENATAIDSCDLMELRARLKEARDWTLRTRCNVERALLILGSGDGQR